MNVLTTAVVGASLLFPAHQIRAQLEDLVQAKEITAGPVRVSDISSSWADAVGVRELETGKPAAAHGHVRIGSTTKTFVATVVLQLVDEGRLRLDDPIQRHLPGVVPDGERAGTTPTPTTSWPDC